jgi:hypothetical protein
MIPGVRSSEDATGFDEVYALDMYILDGRCSLHCGYFRHM